MQCNVLLAQVLHCCWSGNEQQQCLTCVFHALPTQALTFTVSVLEAEQSALKTKRGVTNELVAEHANGAVTNLITAVQPGATMSNVALFIDENRASLQPASSTKTWWLFCGPWCWVSRRPGLLPAVHA
jgi:hypothetical protein